MSLREVIAGMQRAVAELGATALARQLQIVARAIRVVITIKRSLSSAETLDTVLHEWAHAYSGDFTHGPRWGAAYARAYRAYHGCT